MFFGFRARICRFFLFSGSNEVHPLGPKAQMRAQKRSILSMFLGFLCVCFCSKVSPLFRFSGTDIQRKGQIWPIVEYLCSAYSCFGAQMKFTLAPMGPRGPGLGPRIEPLMDLKGFMVSSCTYAILHSPCIFFRSPE